MPSNDEESRQGVAAKTSGTSTIPAKKKKHIERILELDTRTGLFVPTKWKSPYSFRKKDYIAILIGVHKRYEFERVFIEKSEFELDENDEREIGIGFKPMNFKDGMIIEEKYSYKEDNSFVTKTNYFKISVLEDVITGEKLSKSKIREDLSIMQQQIYEEIKELMHNYGEGFVLGTMTNILEQKKLLERKSVNLLFFDKLITR